jgi:hypothetical protein
MFTFFVEIIFFVRSSHSNNACTVSVQAFYFTLRIVRDLKAAVPRMKRDHPSNASITLSNAFARFSAAS